MKTEQYAKPHSVEEAYELLSRHDSAGLIGGGGYTNLSGQRFKLAIDLFDAGLDYVRDKDGAIHVGAMATYRAAETDPSLLALADGLIPCSIKDIVGVHMRNIFTVGGTVCGRYGFSHLNAALLALDAGLVFYIRGTLPLSDFLGGDVPERDILTEVVINKNRARGSFQAAYRSNTDFAVLAVAAVRLGDSVRIAVGARPGRALLADDAMKIVNDHLSSGKGSTEEIAIQAGVAAANELEFGRDARGGSVYRQRICSPLVERAVREVLS